MKIAGGILGFMLFAGLGFIVYQLVKGRSNTAASGGNWLTKPAQSSTFAPDTGSVAGNIAAGFAGSQARSGRAHF